MSAEPVQKPAIPLWGSVLMTVGGTTALGFIPDVFGPFATVSAFVICLLVAGIGALSAIPTLRTHYLPAWRQRWQAVSFLTKRRTYYGAAVVLVILAFWLGRTTKPVAERTPLATDNRGRINLTYPPEPQAEQGRIAELESQNAALEAELGRLQAIVDPPWRETERKILALAAELGESPREIDPKFYPGLNFDYFVRAGDVVYQRSSDPDSMVVVENRIGLGSCWTNRVRALNIMRPKLESMLIDVGVHEFTGGATWLVVFKKLVVDDQFSSADLLSALEEVNAADRIARRALGEVCP